MATQEPLWNDTVMRYNMMQWVLQPLLIEFCCRHCRPSILCRYTRLSHLVYAGLFVSLMSSISCVHQPTKWIQHRIKILLPLTVPLSLFRSDHIAVQTLTPRVGVNITSLLGIKGPDYSSCSQDFKDGTNILSVTCVLLHACMHMHACLLHADPRTAAAEGVARVHVCLCWCIRVCVA